MSQSQTAPSAQKNPSWLVKTLDNKATWAAASAVIMALYPVVDQALHSTSHAGIIMALITGVIGIIKTENL